MIAFYNEVEPYAAEWLRSLVAAGHVAAGHVDSRSIEDVSPRDVRSATQAHFFAGIGGWSYALRLAGWPDDVPVWTGSCPCQPFSAAGDKKGLSDARHLWPVWFGLIRECAPAIVFGEQVASPDSFDWLDVVSADLESAGYAFAAADLCAAGVGAPHVRQRLYFVAARAGALGDTGCARLARWSRESGDDGEEQQAAERASHWAAAEWLSCTDGRARPVEPGVCPLADGVSTRVGRLRAYGNAVVPQVAATFIRSVMEGM